MKKKIFRDMKKILSLILIAMFFMACETDKKNTNKEEEHHHEEGGSDEVRLNKQQCDALNLKLGDFQMRNLTTVVKVNGQLEVSPDHKAEITTLIGGNVKTIKVFHGDKVRKGQVLALLEHPDFISLQEQYAEYASSLEYLEQDYKRQEELSESKAGSNKDYQKAKADYYTAKARYQGLRSRLLLLNLSPDDVQKGKISNTIRLISPINGFVNEINVKIGSFVGPNDKLFEITDNSAIHADFMVYEKDVHLIKKGQIIHFTVANRPEEEFTASIFAIGKEFASNTRAVHVHSMINENSKGLLPGMYITGHLHTDEKSTQTLPDDAIVSEGTKSYIFVLLDSDEDNHNHEVEEESHEGHNNQDEHQHEESIEMTFKIVEVMIGTKDDGYTEVKLIEPLPKNTKIVLNAAYYLLADMKKEETEHKH
jgi:cobalt-zinc-cadmium efflux system membrane fusion protein